jgi:hypothetical protein
MTWMFERSMLGLPTALPSRIGHGLSSLDPFVTRSPVNKWYVAASIANRFSGRETGSSRCKRHPTLLCDVHATTSDLRSR